MYGSPYRSPFSVKGSPGLSPSFERREYSPSRRSLASPSASYRPSSFTYSEEFVGQLERNHERALKSVYDKLSAQEAEHETNTENLRRQLMELRRQIEAADDQHEREITNINQEANLRRENLIKEKDSVVLNLRNQIQEAKVSLSQQKTRSQEDQASVTEEIAKYRSSNNELREKIRVLTKEIDYYHQEFQGTEQEIGRIEKLKRETVRDHEAEVSAIRRHHQTRMADLEDLILRKDSEIKHLENEVFALKTEVADKQENHSKDVEHFEQVLNSTLKMTEMQERDLQRITTAREETFKHRNVLINEKDKLTKEIRQLSKENQDLLEKIANLERLVYGRKL